MRIIRSAGAFLGLFVFLSALLLAMPEAVASANANSAVLLADGAGGNSSVIQVMTEKAAPVIAYLKVECEKYGWWRIGTFFVLTWVLQFLAAWRVSKLLTPTNGTLKNTGYMYLYTWLTSVGFVFLAYLCFRTDSFLVFLLLLPIFLIVNFVIVMKVYEIGFFKTIGFHICYFIACALVPIVPQIFLGTLPWTTLAKKSPEERAAIYREWDTKTHEAKNHELSSVSPSAASGATPAPAAAARATPTASGAGPADVRAMYERLQQERASLDTHNPAAVAQFNQHVAEYAALNARLAAATSPAPAAATAAKKPKATPARKN